MDMHRTNTSCFNWSNRLPRPVVQNHKPRHTHAHTLQGCTVGTPNKDLSGLFICRTLQKSHWSASTFAVAVALVHHTYGQLKCTAKRGETVRRTEELSALLQHLWDKFLCYFCKSCRGLMDYLLSIFCAGKWAFRPELVFWKKGKD